MFAISLEGENNMEIGKAVSDNSRKGTNVTEVLPSNFSKGRGNKGSSVYPSKTNKVKGGMI